MANSTVVSNVIKTLGGFTIGVAVTTGLHSFTGTSFLTNTQTEVNDYVTNVQDSMNELSSYLDGNNVLNDEVIKQYKDALKEANSNIDQLIAYYSANESATNEELAQLQAQVNNLQANVDAQVQAQVDEVIAKANAEIDKANTESETTYNNVHATLTGSDVDEMVRNIENNNKELTVTDEELQVRDISGIVGGSQTPTTPQEPSVQEPTTTPEKPSQTPNVDDKSEETTNLSITNVEQLGTSSQFYYTFSDGKRFKVIMRNFKVYEVFATADSDGRQRVYDMNWTNDTNDSNYSTEFAEFMNNGYRDLIDNH